MASVESDGEARALAALAVQARVHPANPLAHPRSLVSRASNWRKVKGTCPWCNEPSGEPEPSWHRECRRYYHAARGVTYFELNGKRTPLVPKTPCVKCGREAHEIDHIVPLSTARWPNGTYLLKAWTLQNLQWLCRRCHSGKTAQEAKAPQTRVIGHKPRQLSLL